MNKVSVLQEIEQLQEELIKVRADHNRRTQDMETEEVNQFEQC